MGRTTSLNVVQRRQELDEKIEILEAHLHKLKVQRNALSPSMTLPTEIWANIFTHVKRIQQQPNTNYEHSLKWIRVSHVCRYWREICLSVSHLWNTLYSKWDQERLQVMLERSGSSLLRVYHYNFRGDQATKTLVPHIHRIQSLQLAGLKYDLDHTFTMLSQPAPCLEELIITDGSERDGHLPFDIFGGQTPRLRRLCIRSFNPNLASCTFIASSTALTSLEIINSLRSDIRSPATELRAVLTACSALCDLVLHCACPDPSTYLGSTPGRFINLPSLRKLYVQDRHDRLGGLFANLHFPDNARLLVEVLVPDEDAPRPEYHTSLSSLLEHMKHTFTSDRCTMLWVTSCLSERSVSLRWNRASDSALDSTLSFVPWRIHVDEDVSLKLLYTALIQVCTALPLNTVHHLYQSNIQLQAGELARIWNPATNLKSMRLSSNCEITRFIAATRGEQWCISNKDTNPEILGGWHTTGIPAAGALSINANRLIMEDAIHCIHAIGGMRGFLDWHTFVRSRSPRLEKVVLLRNRKHEVPSFTDKHWNWLSAIPGIEVHDSTDYQDCFDNVRQINWHED